MLTVHTLQDHPVKEQGGMTMCLYGVFAAWKQAVAPVDLT